MGLKFGLICLFLASGAFAAPRDSSKVSVSVLVGIVDIDSINYINDQVDAVLEAIPDSVDFHFVPLGLINSTENGLWHCPGGEVECELDRANICLLKKANQTQAEMMWQCESMGLGMWPGPDPFNMDDIEILLKECGAMYAPDFDKVTECRNGEESTQYLKEYEKFLKESGIKKLPAVSFNNKYNKDLDAAAQKDLLGTVCGLLEPKPSGCNK